MICVARGNWHLDSVPSKFVLLQFCDFYQGSKQSDFQWTTSMDWKYYPFPPSLHNKDMVAAVNPRKAPALSLNGLR